MTDRANYAKGQPVIITVTQTNTGPTCTGTRPLYCGADALAYEANKTLVWFSYAESPGPHGFYKCADNRIYTNPHGGSVTISITWQQDPCPGPPGLYGENPQCPHTQVAAGNYTITVREDQEAVYFLGNQIGKSMNITIAA